MTRITASPGGASSVVLGSYGIEPLKTNGTAPAPAPPPAQAIVDAPAVVETPAGAGEFEALKLQAIAAISNLSTSSDALKIVSDLVQSLGSIGAQPRAVLKADDALGRLRETLKARGTHGIISIGKLFKIIDDDGDNKLRFEEFSKAMKEHCIEGPDVHKLFRYFDADCSGYLSFDELLVGLKGQLNERRLDMVKRAFKVLDVTGDGVVTMADIRGRYNAKMHPDVLLGTKSEDEVLAEFMGTFEAQGGGDKGDGIITFDEFKKYYESISASIDLDDYFELVIRNAWHISGGEGWCANTTCKRVLVLHDDGTQAVHEIKDDFDVTADQYLQKLKDQGVQNIKAIALYGEPSDVPDGKGEPPKSPPPAALSSPSSATAAAASRNRRQQQASSITFG